MSTFPLQSRIESAARNAVASSRMSVCTPFSLVAGYRIRCYSQRFAALGRAAGIMPVITLNTLRRNRQWAR
jgi:hypothetical protein